MVAVQGERGLRRWQPVHLRRLRAEVSRALWFRVRGGSLYVYASLRWSAFAASALLRRRHCLSHSHWSARSSMSTEALVGPSPCFLFPAGEEVKSPRVSTARMVTSRASFRPALGRGKTPSTCSAASRKPAARANPPCVEASAGMGCALRTTCATTATWSTATGARRFVCWTPASRAPRVRIAQRVSATMGRTAAMNARCPMSAATASLKRVMPATTATPPTMAMVAARRACSPTARHAPATDSATPESATSSNRIPASPRAPAVTASGSRARSATTGILDRTTAAC